MNSWPCGKGVSPVPAHPGPLPKGEGELSPAWQQIEASRHLARRPTEHPLLWGEGWGEGERGCRTDAAAQNVFGPRETEPQFLAALG